MVNRLGPATCSICKVSVGVLRAELHLSCQSQAWLATKLKWSPTDGANDLVVSVHKGRRAVMIWSLRKKPRKALEHGVISSRDASDNRDRGTTADATAEVVKND